MSTQISQTNPAVDTGLAPRHLDAIQEIVAQIFNDTSCVVYLFGSRARGTHTPTSDIDIAVASSEDVDEKLAALREALEISNLPLFVDVVDLSQTAITFIENVQSEGIVIWRN